MSLPAVQVSTPSPADYEMIETAVMETARGRWFLAEYARRNRHAETEKVLDALARLERSMAERTAPAPAAMVGPAHIDTVLREMAGAIARTKAEIAALRPESEGEGPIAEASMELDAIVATTEEATSDILAAAEEIQEVAWTLREQGLEDEVCDVLDARATGIYTACAFQDLTGQRTRKVIQVLKYLEDRLAAMIGSAAGEQTNAPQITGDRALLNGPALPGQGLGQDDVDAVMGAARRIEPSPSAMPEPPRPREPEPVAPRVSKPVSAPAMITRSSAAVALAVEPVHVEAPAIAPERPDPLDQLDAMTFEEKSVLFG